MSGIDISSPLMRTVRADLNPLDKSTIFSILPKLVDERKCTLQPGRFIIEPGSYNKPSFLIVTSSSWWKFVDENQPLLEIPISSVVIADSVVRDYCNGLLAFSPTEQPGLFFIPGVITIEELKSKYKKELDEVNQKQKNWFLRLVKMADALWSRSNSNPLAISDDMRLAARELGIEGKEWMADFQSVELIRCIACGAMRDPGFPICGSCHTVIDVEKAKKLGLQFIQR